MLLGRQNILFRTADGGSGGGTPPAGTPPAGTPPAGTPPAGTPPAGGTAPNPELAALQAQLAALQAERDQFKSAIDKAENEKLSEVDRLKKERDALAAAQETATQTLRQARAETAVTQEAVKVGADPSLVNRLITVQYDQNGNPINVDKAVQDLVKAHPYLVQGTATGGSMSNGARQTGGASTFSKAQIANMSAADYEKNREAIMRASKAGLITD